MNRRQRRALRSRAAAIAREVAVGVVIEGDDGGLAKVAHPRAIAILREEMVASLQTGGAPVVRKLTEAEAAVFPHVACGSACTPAWLAVALGCDGRMGVVVRRLRAIGDTTNDAAAAAVVIAEVAELAASPSIPGLDHVRGTG